jgi:1-deoxy-D-xylulose-5-phosphate reductoisomerase
LNKQKLAILGSTGSIGTQVLEVVRQHPDKFEIIALTANNSWELLSEQIKEFSPKIALICNDDHYSDLKKSAGSHTEILSGMENLVTIVTHPDVDTVLNSLVGFSGFIPTVEALKSGKKVALANKESLVVGGEYIRTILDQYSGTLIPVESEHSAMLQSIVGEKPENIEKIIITASGGPFRELTKEQMQNVTLEQALDHPNWDMGAKITIDSATMMNKGLEIIEAKWLFDIPVSKIEPVIHPQSIIHSMVTYVDGSSKAQLGPPDMKVPIIYALTYPDRLALDTPRMNWSEAQELTFYPVDYEKFPCLKLAINAIEEGGVAPAVLNAANEVAVKRFLDREINYIDIPKIVEGCLNKMVLSHDVEIDSLIEIDKEARQLAAHIN